MRRLIDGRRSTEWYDTSKTGGCFQRGDGLGSPLRRRSALSLPLVLSGLMQASLASAAEMPTVYVSSELSDTVVAVAGDPPQAIREVAVGNRPHNLEATGSGLLLVATQGEDSISVVAPGNDPPTVSRISLGAPPHDIAVAEDGITAYVLSEQGLLAHVDPSSGDILKTVELSGRPHNLIAAAGSVWITDISSRRIFVVGDGLSIRELPISIVGHALALRPGSKELWITPWDGDRTVIVDSSTGEEIADLQVGENPSHKHVVFNEDGSEAWVSEPASGSIFVVEASTRSVAERIDVGGHPHHVRLADGRAYVTVGPDDLVVLDARDRSVVSRLPAGSGVHDVELVDPAR